MTDDVKDYRVEVKVRNNRILRRIEALGFDNLSAFARQYGLSYSPLCALISMKESALRKKLTEFDADKPRKLVLQLCSALACEVEDLFNERQLIAAVKAGTHVFEMDEPPFVSLEDPRTMLLAAPERTDEHADLHEARKRIAEQLYLLPPRHAQVLRLRYGLDDHEEHTLEECGKALGGLSRERIRQMEAKALRTLKTKAHRKNLDGLLGVNAPPERTYPRDDIGHRLRIERAHQMMDERAKRIEDEWAARNEWTAQITAKQRPKYGDWVRYDDWIAREATDE